MNSTLLKEMIPLVNQYIQEKEYMTIENLYHKIKTYCNVDMVSLLQVNITENNLNLFPDKNNNIMLDSSLTLYTIQNKNFIFENHLISTKLYEPSIDNIESFKIRSLFILPIIKNKKVIGLCYLYRQLGNKTVFNRQDFKHFSTLMPLVLKLLTDTSLSKEEMLNVLDTKKKKNNLDEIKNYENKIKRNEVKYNEALEKLEEKNKLLNKKLITLSKEYALLNTKTTEQKNEKNDNEPVVLVKTEKVIEKNDYTSEYLSYEKLIKNMRDHFKLEQNTRILFDLITSAMYSPKGMAMLEDAISSSNMVHTLLGKYSLRQTIPVVHDKFKVLDLIETLKGYEKSIFNHQIKLDIKSDYNMPQVLHFDSLKIENIILYLFIDAFQFIDHSQTVLMNLKYENRYLVFSIHTKIHQKNSVFTALLKRNAIFKSEGRLCFEYATRLLGYLNGRIENEYKPNDYTYTVYIPAKTM